MCSELGNPINSQVSPASILFQAPLPEETLPLNVCSPSPTYITLGSDSDTAIDPIDPPKYPSLIDFQVLPALVVFQTPPPAVPI